MDLSAVKNHLPGENDTLCITDPDPRFNLKSGDILNGAIRVKSQSEKFGALLFVESVNGYRPEAAARRKHFEDLTPIFPNHKLRLETERGRRFRCAWWICSLLWKRGRGV